MCIRDRLTLFEILEVASRADLKSDLLQELERQKQVLLSFRNNPCLLYTSDAADERSSVDLGGRRIIKKKKNIPRPTEQFFFSSRRRHTRCSGVSWARRCV